VHENSKTSALVKSQWIMRPYYSPHYASCPSVRASLCPALDFKAKTKKPGRATIGGNVFHCRSSQRDNFQFKKNQMSRLPDVQNLKKMAHISPNHGFVVV